ncbi:MAG: hypothetical protein HOU81_06415 [Hamadaea sp.]|uniref:hypothetical protein n=1 Tax=Hamadaea sp. TaxID=2024425 RepID=UPI0017E297CA|nr:hypothetical protein [Hamadaea sp.]NUR70433.1 hypothetical protein [Hamadaea sp.]NUT20023.1 hypothetical protein [Hamadaea sp.]
MEETHRHQAAAIYGTIISGSVMAAAPQDSVVTVVVLVLVTVFVYWLAERYADLLGAYTLGHRLTRADIRHSLSEGLPMIRASYAPLIVLVVAALLGADTPTALTIAMSFTVLWLFLMGFIAGRRRQMTGWPLVVVTASAGLFGIVLMVLKLSLH